jgi:hypothetical protein
MRLAAGKSSALNHYGTKVRPKDIGHVMKFKQESTIFKQSERHTVSYEGTCDQVRYSIETLGPTVIEIIKSEYFDEMLLNGEFLQLNFNCCLL